MFMLKRIRNFRAWKRLYHNNSYNINSAMVHTYCLLRCDFTLALACGYLILFQVSIRCNHGNRVRLTNHVDGSQ